ncbi:MAG TPA: hypothetical protein QF753_04945 [Victivallales bacterium]|nr:hypothetical protein [Victivallales bacterium]
MTTLLGQLFDLSIVLEKKISNLYFLFSEIFPEDAVLWRQLSSEEKNHSYIIEEARDALFSTGFSSTAIVPKDIDKLKLSIKKVNDLISYYKKNNVSVDRKKAFEDAISIENSSGEFDYEEAMVKQTPTPPPSLKMFQQLNKEDKFHSIRIKKYADNIA